MQDFANRYGPVALVTGASSGIGRSFAAALATRGLDLVLVARRLQRLEELAGELRSQHGVRVQVSPIDLADSTAAQQMLDITSSLEVGLVVSNAGFGLKGPYAAGDPKTLSNMLMVNCHTPMLLARGFVPRLQQRKRGGIVFTSSVEGLIGCPYSAVYSASKAFVRSLGEALWGELTPEGIDILTLCPGATDTEAPRLQGYDPAKMPHLMSPDEVVRLTLEKLRSGPTFIASPHYQASFDQLLALPRAQALTAMARGMKPSV
jgi:uncharacterized protein